MKDPEPSGQLVAAYKAALEIADKMRAEGIAREDRDAYVAGVLKAAWPKGRSQPWRYLCDLCDDTGWRIKTCQHGSCGRPFRLPGQHSDDKTGQGKCGEGHSFGEPCACAKGEEQRRLLLKQRAPEDAIAVAAKSKFTRAGR